MAEINWAYVAGFFDGEGHVALNEQTKGKLRPTLVIGQSVRPDLVLEHIRTFLVSVGIPARIYNRKRNAKTKITHLDHQRLHIVDQEAVPSAIIQMLPYLTVKRDASLRALEIFKARPRITHRPFTEEEIIASLTFYTSEKSWRQLHSETGVHRSSVQRFLRSYPNPHSNSLKQISA